MIDVGLVHSSTIPYIWEDVQEVILTKGQAWLETVDLQEVLQLLLRQELDLWIGTDETDLAFVAICGWENHSKRRFYHVMWVGGRGLLSCLKDATSKMEQFACSCGATEVVFGGRDGWEKVMRKMGYTASLQMRKNVQVWWRH